MKAYHFLRNDWRADYSDEAPWRVSETRRMYGPIALCQRGYHSSPTWLDALQYASGPVACVVDVSKPAATDGSKQVSRRRTLLSAFNAERELRLFAADCTGRRLGRERHEGREPDPRSWRTVKLTVRHSFGLDTAEEWEVAREAARGPAREAAPGVAWDVLYAPAHLAARGAALLAGEIAAWNAAQEAGEVAAWDPAQLAAWDAEIAWQRNRLDWRLGKASSVRLAGGRER
jgi:hypothetical protein